MRPAEASADEARQMLRELLIACGPRRRLAALLSTNYLTIGHWLSGYRSPDRSSRRVIWYTWCLLLHPERLRSVGDLLTWGRVSEAHERERSTCQYPGWDFEI